MGKTKPKRKGVAGPRAPAARAPTAQQLYEQAQLALQYDDFDSARAALKRAAKLEPSNVEILDALGALLAEVGPEDEALLVLRHAVRLSPDQGYEKYLYLGQLLDGPEAMGATRKGVQVLKAQHAAAVAEGSKAAKPLSFALSGALCSLSEMLLASAGEDVTPVAAEVEACLQQASAADPDSPEPGQALASLRYEQGRAEEALAALKASMALWFEPTKGEGGEEEEDEDGDVDVEGRPGQEAGPSNAGAGKKGAAGDGDGDGDAEMEAASGSGDDGDDDEDDDEEDDGLPSYEFRLECAKLLLELDDTTATAIDVLEGLIEEDDRVPVAWHLLALAYYSGQQYTEAAEVVAKGQALAKALGAGAEDEVVVVLGELGAAVAEAQAGAGAGSAAGGGPSGEGA